MSPRLRVASSTSVATGGRGTLEASGQPGEEFQLRHGFAIDGVVDFARPAPLEGGDQRAGRVVPMDHVDPTGTRPWMRASPEELLEQMTPPGP